MQAPGCRPDKLGQPRFDIEMDVLQRPLEDECALGDFARDRVQSFQDCLGVFFRDNALCGQHARMRTRAGQVLFRQSFVEIDGGGNLLHDLGRAAGETAAPHRVLDHGTHVTLPRFRPLTIAVAIGVAALLGVLYWIARPPVHALPDSLKPLAETTPPKPVAAMVFTGTDGKLHSLDEFKGRLVLFNLWAPWCAPCVKELPALAALEQALPKDHFAVVAVDVGRNSAADAQAFINAHGAGALAAYHDGNESVFRAYGAFGLPMSLLIDGKGQEIARALGPADWSAPDSVAYLKGLAER